MVDYPPKTSVKNLPALLQDVTVLVVDPDLPIANIIKHVLNSLGFGNIIIRHSGAEAAEIFKSQTIDFIITDFDMTTVDGEQSFVEFVRNSPESPNPSVPVIMLTGHTEQQEVEMARDLGVSEIAAKPFTAKSLCDRIVRIIENPRSFIITKRYTGPDRRRKTDGPPENSADRRSGRKGSAKDRKSGTDSPKKTKSGFRILERWIGKKHE